MRAMTLEKLLQYTDDKKLLDLYTELASGKIPSTSYAHEFCRKVNRMVDDGDLCVGEGRFRHIYLPTLSKAVYKEMASRYAIYMRNYKAPEPEVAFESVQNGDADDDVRKCSWCNGEYETSDLVPTDLGMICRTCFEAIRSRGEDVCVLA